MNTLRYYEYQYLMNTKIVSKVYIRKCSKNAKYEKKEKQRHD